jgi:hypothetical protein
MMTLQPVVPVQQVSVTRTLLAIVLFVAAVVALMIVAYAIFGLNVAAPSLDIVGDPASGILH